MTHTQETGLGTSFKALARRWVTYFLSANMLLTQVAHAFESPLQVSFEHEWVREDQAPLTRMSLGDQILDFGSLQKGQKGHVDLGGKHYTYGLKKLDAGLRSESGEGAAGSVVRLRSQDKGLRLRFLLGRDGSVTLLSSRARDQFTVVSAGDIVFGAGVHDIALAHFEARSVTNEGRCRIRQALSVRATGDSKASEDNTQEGEERVEGTPGFFFNAPGASLTCEGQLFMLGGADFANQGLLRVPGALSLRMDGGDFIHGGGGDASASLEVKSAMVIDGAADVLLRAPVRKGGEGASLTVSSKFFQADTGEAAQNPDADNLTLDALTIGAQKTHIGASTRARVGSAQFNRDMEAAGQRVLVIDGHVQAAEVAHLTAGETLIAKTAVVTGDRVEGSGGTLTNHGHVTGQELSWTYGTRITNTGQLAFASRIFAKTEAFGNYGVMCGTDIDIAADGFLNKGLIGGMLQGEGARQVKIFARVGGLNEGEILASKVMIAMGREVFTTLHNTAQGQGENAPPQEAQETQGESPKKPSFLNKGRVMASAKLTLKGKGEVTNAGRMEGDKISLKKDTRLYNMAEGGDQAVLRGKKMFFKGADVFLNGGIFEMNGVEGSLGTFENQGLAHAATWNVSAKTLHNVGLVTGAGLLRAKNFVNFISGTVAGALTLDVAEQGDNEGTIEVLSLVGQGHFFNTSHARLTRIDISTFVNQGMLVGETLTFGKNLTRFENAFKPSPDSDDPQGEEPAVVKVNQLVSEDTGAIERTIINKGTVSAPETTLHGRVILGTLSKWASRVFTWVGSVFAIKDLGKLKVAEQGRFTGKVLNAARLSLEAPSLTFSNLENAGRVTFGAQTAAQVDHLKNTGDVRGARTLSVGTLDNAKNISVSSLHARGLVNNKGTITLQGRENTFDHVGNEGKIIVPRGAHADIYNLISNNSVEGEGALTIGELENWGAMKLTKLVVRRYFFNVHTLDAKPHVVIQDLAVTNESLASYAPAQILTLRNEGHLEVGRAVIKGDVELEVGSTFAVGDSLDWQGALWDQKEDALLVGAHTTFDGAVHNQGEIVLDGGANTFTHLTNGGMLRATGAADLNTQTLINTGSVNAVSTGEVRVQDLQNRGFFAVENSRSLSIIRGENHHNLLIDKSHIAFLPHAFSNHKYVFLGTSTGHLWHFNNANGTLHLCEPTNISELLYNPDMGRIRSEEPLTIETPDMMTFRMFLALMRGADIEAPLVIDATGIPSLDLNVALALRGAVTFKAQEFTCNASVTAPSIRVEAQKTTNLGEMNATDGDLFLQNVAVMGKVGASETLTIDRALADITLHGTNLITHAKNVLMNLPGRLVTNFQTLSMGGWMTVYGKTFANYEAVRALKKITMILGEGFENGKINPAAYNGGTGPDAETVMHWGVLESAQDDIDISAGKYLHNDAGEVLARGILKVIAGDHIYNGSVAREFRSIPNVSQKNTFNRTYHYNLSNGSFMFAGTHLHLNGKSNLTNTGGTLFSLGTMDVRSFKVLENRYGLIFSVGKGSVTAPEITNTRSDIVRNIAYTSQGEDGHVYIRSSGLFRGYSVPRERAICYTQDEMSGQQIALPKTGEFFHRGCQDFLTSGPGLMGSLSDLTLRATRSITNNMGHIYAGGVLIENGRKINNVNGTLYHHDFRKPCDRYHHGHYGICREQLVKASCSGVDGLTLENVYSILNTGTLAGGVVIANVMENYVQMARAGASTPRTLPAFIPLTAGPLASFLGRLMSTNMTQGEGRELSGILEQVAGHLGEDVGRQIEQAQAQSRPALAGASPLSLLTHVAQSGSSTALVPVDGPAPLAPSFSLSRTSAPTGPVEVGTLLFHPGMSPDRFFQAILHKPIRRHLDDIDARISFQAACLSHLGCAAFDMNRLRENAANLATTHASSGARMVDLEAFNRSNQMVLVDAPFETSTHFELITLIAFSQALRQDPRLLCLAGGNGVTFAQHGMQITAQGAIQNTGAFVSPANISLEAPLQEHAAQLETITDGVNTRQVRTPGTGTVDAGGVAYLGADALLTQGADISGEEGTLARIRQILQAVPLMAYSRTRLHNGSLTTHTPLPSIYSSARGPVALYGDGAKHLTGTHLKSPVANFIFGSSVEAAPAFAQSLRQETHTKKGGFFRGSKTITVHTQTVTPRPVHCDAPQTTIATTDAAGVLNLHAPTYTGGFTALSNTSNLLSVEERVHTVIQKIITNPMTTRVSSSEITQVTQRGMDTQNLVCEAHDDAFVQETTRMLEEALPAPILPPLLEGTPVEGPMSEAESAALIPAPVPSSSSSATSTSATTAPSAPSLPGVSPSARALARAINEEALAPRGPIQVPTYTPRGTSAGANITISLTDAMAADPAVQDFVKRTGATTRIVHDTLEDIHTSQASLGMAPMLAIGVIMNMVLPGSSALAQLASATVSCLAPKFVNGVVRDGTISGGVRDITSSRALKDLVMTMFTPCPGGSVAGSLNLINHFINAVKSAVWRLPLEAVLGEGSLQDIFTASALSAVANATCGFAASHIGELSHPGGNATGGIAPPVAVLLHGAVGAGMSAIQGRDILSGAVGAMVGEVSGMIYNRVAMADMGRNHPRRAEAIRRGTDVARLTGIAVAGIGGLDPAAASCAAANAAENNAVQLIVPALVVAAEALTTAEGVCVLGTGAVATSLALQHGLASQENSTGDPYAAPRSSNAPSDPFYDPYGSAPRSSSSSRPFGDGPNTGSVLYVAPPAQPARAPGVYESLRDLPRSLGMTPPPLHLPLPGFTPHTARPSILATPRHDPSVIPLWTPGYFCRPSVHAASDASNGPRTLWTPVHPNGPSIFMKKSASSSSKKPVEERTETSEPQAHKGSSGPVEAPETLEAFPDAKKAKRKTPKQNGGGLRKRWKTRDKIFEWDSRHGTLEAYDKRGRHLGEFDPKTGRQLKEANPKYKIDP